MENAGSVPWTKLNFFDDYWLDFKLNVLRRWYSPKLVSQYADPSLRSGGVYHSAEWCPEQGRYLMWYEYLPDAAMDEERYVALAESADGVHWAPADAGTAPDPENHIYRNTVYLGSRGVHGSSVLRDEAEPDPARRYKMTGATRACAWRENGIENSAVRVSVSPDGVRWREDAACLVWRHTSDTSNCMYRNPVTGDYCVILRAGFVDRRICLTRSKDLKTWSRPEVILHPGADFNDDAFATQLYGMPVTRLGDSFLGCLWLYRTSCGDMDFTRMTGFIDSELTYSYDGLHWMRTSRRPLAERPPAPEFGFSSLYLERFYPSADGTRLFLVGNGCRTMHASQEDNARFRAASGEPLSAALIYEIRPDGFCGLEANATGGYVVTKAFELCGGEVFFNLSVPFGRARFALLQADGKPYEGFDFGDCIPFTGDALRHRPAFRGADTASLRGKRVRFALKLDGGVLHCIEGRLRPWVRVPQASLGDPCQL